MRVYLFMGNHVGATGRHMPYGITQCTVTCHPTQVYARPALTPASKLVLKPNLL